MASPGTARVTSTSPAILLAKAATRAAERLSIRQRDLGEIIGISPATVSRAAHGGSLPEDGKAIELATLFIRTFRALDAVVGGDEAVAAAWMRNHNTALGGEPLALMKTAGPGRLPCLSRRAPRACLSLP